MHCLRTNSENKMEKVIGILSSNLFTVNIEYSDLTLRDKQNRLAH